MPLLKGFALGAITALVWIFVEWIIGEGDKLDF